MSDARHPRNKPVSIVWFRQDLRLADNPALAAAAAAGAVLPVYVLDDEAAGDWAMGGAHRWWLHGSLGTLAPALQRLGAELVLRRGSAATIIPELAAACGATAVHAGQMLEPWAREQEAAIARALGDGVKLHLHRVATLFDPGTILTKAGKVFGVYTPFANAARALGAPMPPQPAPKRLQGVKAASDTLESWGLLPKKPDWAGGFRDAWQPGEAAAHARLAQFLAKALPGYPAGRNVPGEDLTSMLSPHLHWGELSPAQVWHAAEQAGRKEAPSASAAASPARSRQREQETGGAGEKSATSLDTALKVFLSELLWHEFSANVLWADARLAEQPQRAGFRRLKWRTDAAGLHAWQRGQTGVPIVDAGMRQLWHIGWMHNRVRMITGSFLVKHLLVSWTLGERWFWDTLVDGDMAANSQSWQWVAGTGTDSQPFFRVFNPVTQSGKFDAKGTYIRRWVPEVAALPDRWIHAPWTAPPEVLAEARLEVGKDYPKPIVALDEGRDRALAAFKAMRAA